MTLRVLVADDSRTQRIIVSALLRDLGAEVVAATSGRDGLATLRAGPRFDLALVDWDMPDGDGLWLVRAVRADASLADVRLVMITVVNDHDQIRLAVEAGVDEYLMKPFSPEMLLDKLAILGLTAGCP